MSIDDEPLGNIDPGLPPLPQKHIQHQWYDQYAGTFMAFVEQELAVNLPPAQYKHLYRDAVETAHLHLVQMVAFTLTGVTVTAITRKKVEES